MIGDLPESCRSFAFYLPQYHPIQENDDWWGTGFTEWRNVAKARPCFPGHYQPHLPSDLGFYDLRVPEVRELQAEMAMGAGVDGFVYYHYWFNGRRLLERPISDILKSGRPALPFCLAWANENWTRTWDGGERDVLMEQRYSPEDDVAHIRALRPALTDERYLCYQGRPIFLVYRSSRLPEPRATTERWRQEAASWGLKGLYLLRIESRGDDVGDPRADGFDAAVEFQPRWWDLPPSPKVYALSARLSKYSDRLSHNVRRYTDVAERAMATPVPGYPRWPGLTPGFDNSPRRRKSALILLDSSPDKYAEWLAACLARGAMMAQRWAPGSGGMVFVNAWNEWGEGNHLEPDLRHGRAYLDAHRRTVERFSRVPARPDDGPDPLRVSEPALVTNLSELA